MNKPNVAKFIKNVRTAVSQHSPEILTGIGIAGMVTTTVLAVKATPKAIELLDGKKKEERTEELTPVETVKTVWKCYVPAAVTCAVSITCIIGASSVNARRNAALATAYKLSETALTEYKEKVIETIGEKKEQIVRDKIKEDHVAKNPVGENKVIITEKGNTLCYDSVSGRYFRSDIEKIKRAANELNRQMLTDMTGYVSLNDFYDELGLEHISIGNDLGWNVGKGLIEIDPGSCLTPDNEPCLVIDYVVAPKYAYDSYI